jgi:hypothetical protein
MQMVACVFQRLEYWLVRDLNLVNDMPNNTKLTIPTHMSHSH